MWRLTAPSTTVPAGLADRIERFEKSRCVYPPELQKLLSDIKDYLGQVDGEEQHAVEKDLDTELEGIESAARP